MLYDRRAGQWSRVLLERIGVPLEKMPPIRDATSVAGGVSHEAAHATGLRTGTPVVVGGGDVQCTLVGAYVHNPQVTEAPPRSCLYLGTAAWMSAGQPRPAGRFFTADCFGATSTTGAAVKWLVSLWNTAPPSVPPLSYDALVAEADSAPLGARGLVFLPHLMGERGPVPSPEAKGVLYGLNLAHRRADIARAVLEGCAYQIRWIAETLGLDGGDEVVVVGGGAKSQIWLRIIADVLGMPLAVPRVLEAGALGAAILAGVGVGVYPSVQSAAREIVQVSQRLEPNAGAHEAYGRIYEVYLKLERCLAPLYGRALVAGSA
jgi:xylulokinase